MESGLRPVTSVHMICGFRLFCVRIIVNFKNSYGMYMPPLHLKYELLLNYHFECFVIRNLPLGKVFYF